MVINPTGGPMICVNEEIDGTDDLIPIKIIMDENTNRFLIYTVLSDIDTAPIAARTSSSVIFFFLFCRFFLIITFHKT